MKESEIQRNIRLALGQRGIPALRNNVGTGWAGSKVIHHGDGSVTILNARPLHAGLCTGSSDLIGIIPHTVRKEDVGHQLGIFSAWECKQLKGRLREEQAPFLRMVNSLGGLGAVVRSAEDAVDVVERKWESPLVRKWLTINKS